MANVFTGLVKLIISLALIVAVTWLGIWLTMYFYKDCKKVGHSTFYCIMKSGR